MGLPAQSVDIFLSNNDSRPAPHQGVMGRVQALANASTVHFQPGTPTMPARFSVEPRRAFRSLAQTSKDQFGIALTPNWLDPSYLETVDGQLVSVDSRIPKVWNGYDYWVDYRDTVKLLTSKLREDTIVGGYGTIQCQDSTILGHVEMVCYTLSNTTVWVGFREAPGAASSVRRANDLSSTWLVPPYQIGFNTTGPIIGHVTQDGARFYLFYNNDSTAEFWVYAFDINGQFLDGPAKFAKADTNKVPGYWDITEPVYTDTVSPRPIWHVQPAASTATPGSDVHVTFTKITFTSTIQVTQHTDTTIVCNSRCQFLDNRFDGTKLYLVTTGPGTADLRLRLYQVSKTTLNQDAVYDIADPAATAGDIDSIAGYVISESSALSAYVTVGYLETDQAAGPRFDPQTRYIQTYHRTTGAVTTVRKSGSQALVSRSFKLGAGLAGDDWFNATFYQSGSGLDESETVINYEIQGGDYFTGSQTQTIPVLPLDYTTGSSFSTGLVNVIATTGMGSSAAFLGTDTVASTTSSGSGDFAGIPAGTPLLDWHLGNYPGISTVLSRGGDLAVVGSTGVTGANGHWDVLASSSGAGGHVYTRTTSSTGSSLTPGTFSAGGLFQILAQACYQSGTTGVGDTLAVKFGSLAPTFFVGGTLTATGTSGSNDVTTALITRVTVADEIYGTLGFPIQGAWVPKTVQTTAATAGTELLVPLHPNRWSLDGGADFSAVGVGSTLNVSDDTVNPGNNGSFPITAISPPTVDTGGQTGLVTEVFQAGHLPTVTVDLGTGVVPYTFFLQDLVGELTTNPNRFIGALIQFNSGNPAATGEYRITGYKSPIDGTVYAEPTTTGTDIPAQALVDPPDNITIYLPVATTAPFQPTYFITPVLGKRATVGMFDRLSAYNNWRTGGHNTMQGHLTAVNPTANGSVFVAPTTQERVSTVNANQQVSGTSTVGIKQWMIADDTGHGADKYIPGCQGICFEKDTFPEDGFALAAEQPWLISQGDVGTTGQLGLKTLGTYIYTIVIESQDSAGARVFSPPSPPLTVALTGTHQQITIGGDLMVPWDTTPNNPLTGYFGVTNRLPITIAIYRTSYINGVPTTTRYKITSDLFPNNTTAISGGNPSVFSFASQVNNLHWTYVDQNPDSVIQTNEQDYSLSFLPRFGLPAYSDICLWNDRYFFVLSDGSLGFTTPITDGTRPSWFPGFKVTAPPGERAVTIRPLQQFLIVNCERGTWYLPATALPNAALIDVGQVNIPSLIPLPFTNGSTGQALTSAAGVLYSSTAGGVWNVTRSLTNDFMSEPMVDEFGAMEALGHKVQSMVIDRDQRMAVSTGTTVIVYDLISGLWSEHTLPASLEAGKLCVFDGNVMVRSGAYVLGQVTNDTDNVNGTDYPIDWSIRMAGLSFGSVRAFQRLWRLQVIGQYRGPHNQTLTFTYPDDFPDDPTLCPTIVPDPAKPYLIEAIPGHGKAGQFGVLLEIDHNGHAPGPSCSIELLSAKVGVQSGQKQVPSGQRV